MLAGGVATAGPVTASHLTSTSGNGGGAVQGNHTRDAENSSPPSPLPCGAYTKHEYTTISYTGTYSVHDGTTTYTYTGPLTTTYTVTPPTGQSYIWENPLGSFETKTQCVNGENPGHPYPVTGSLKDADSDPNNGVSCNYTAADPVENGSNWRRVGTDIDMVLVGSWTVTQNGLTSPSVSTHEIRQGVSEPTSVHFPPPTQTLVEETYQA